MVALILSVSGLDFSLSQWLREKTLTAGVVLQPYHVSELFEKLSITAYKRTPSCSRGGFLYASPDTQGWVNGNLQCTVQHILIYDFKDT